MAVRLSALRAGCRLGSIVAQPLRYHIIRVFSGKRPSLIVGEMITLMYTSSSLQDSVPNNSHLPFRRNVFKINVALKCVCNVLYPICVIDVRRGCVCVYIYEYDALTTLLMSTVTGYGLEGSQF
jgi:hypothetical protein